MKQHLEVSKLLTYSILLLFAITLFVVLLGWLFTRKTPEQLQVGVSILTIVAGLLGTIVTGYFVKAGVENVNKNKLRGDSPNDTI